MKTYLFASTLLSGLVAGLFYAYSCSVNGGLKSLSDRDYLAAMQSINKAILNPWFFISFMGLLLVYPLTAYSLYRSEQSVSFYLVLTATLVYFIGVFGVTVFGNVPLNNQLAEFAVSESSDQQLKEMRGLFEGPWNFFHAIRTFACIISFALTILSLLNQKLKI